MGTKGIARIVEVLETVKWNGIKLKPNPIKNIKHKKQFLDYIKEMDDEEFLWEKFGGEKIEEEKKKEIKMVDYPDTEDEGISTFNIFPTSKSIQQHTKYAHSEKSARKYSTTKCYKTPF
ncbi:unnamed protein product [Meloidogyne enterolobii]|uniref:Uncharacterized protein n=1 Tax=Meloidogyne enterolobii TaxID=390850 RepID=A0ACB0XKR4_MELEN